MEGRRRQEITSGDNLEQKKLWQHNFFCVLIILGVLVGTALLAAGGYLFWFYRVRETPPPPDVSRVAPLLRHGDVVLRSGVGLWSELFRAGNPKDRRFSHVGIVRAGKGGTWEVIHADADDLSMAGTVRSDPLERFVGESTKIGVARLKRGDPALLVKRAETLLGRPFDWRFDGADDRAVYCTELIDLALRGVDPAWRLRTAEDGRLWPENCLDPEFFIEIPVETEEILKK